MTRRTCDMETLVEARRDQRLDDAEIATVERHLRTCSSCRRHEEQLDMLRSLARERAPEPLDAMSRRRHRLAILRAASSSSARKEERKSARSYYLLAAAALVAVVVGVAFSGASSRLAERTHRSPTAPSGLVAMERRINATVTAVPDTRFERQELRESSTTTEVVRLHDGSVDVQVDALGSDQRFIVAVGDAEVEVRGTRFTVVAADDELVRVAVSEGRVEVRVGPSVTTLEVGQEWTPQARVAADVAPPSTQPGLQRPRVDHPADTPSNDEQDEGAPEDTASETPPKPAQSVASKAFAGALNELEAGEYDTASDSLRKFAREHPNDARAEDADYLAIVALQRAGRHAAAAQAARRYLARYPKGARRAWAQAIANRTKLDP